MQLPTFITGNQNKADYLAKMLGVTLAHEKIDLDEIQSTDPFEIVEHKVRQAYDIVKKPVLVQDTSLVFNVLNELPGPFIKFFIESENGFENLCRMLDGFNDRTAYALVIYGYFDGETLHFVYGRLDGTIPMHPRGAGGFGWDVIFEPNGYAGKTRAELSPEQDAESYNTLHNFDGLRAFLSPKHSNPTQ